MAGIGVKLNRIFQKNTITTSIYGFFYSTIVTIAPMLVVILNILLMEYVLEFSKLGFLERELFSCSILYIFIFGLIAASPFNAVLSRYMSDVIFEERYEDISSCFYLGLLMNVVFAWLMGVPFCLWEYFVGKVALYYVFTGFCGYVCLVLTFYTMLYLSICKDYKKISLFFFIGMLLSFLSSLVFVWIFGWSVGYSMLLAMTIGFFITGSLELAAVRQYFPVNSHNYRRVLEYFKTYWQLVVTNFLYILGLYVHNFVFWTTDQRMVVVDTFVCAQPYDMATCLAMFTNISASVIFIAQVEMQFHERYKAYSEAVIGGRGIDIDNTKKRMFRQISNELMNLVRIQFIITVVIFLLGMIFLPRYGFSSLTMRIYPCMSAGYFILFLMYSTIIFLYYFNDLNGSALTSVAFFLGTLFGSIFATHLQDVWYGIGVVIGSAAGWTVAYFRVRWVEKNMDAHIFCRGSLLGRGKGVKPPAKVYDLYEKVRQEEEERRRRKEESNAEML